MKKTSQKLNNGCLNIFKFLKLLYADEADYDSVIRIFKEDIEKEKENNNHKAKNLVQVVLNKYVNALKIFGVKIKKEKNKYKLESSLYSLHYTLNELKALSIIENAGSNIPDEDINDNISNLLFNLFLRMGNNDKNMFSQFNSEFDLSFYYSDLKDQIENCKKYCAEHMQLKIIYQIKNKEIKSICIPKEIIYSIKTAYLSVYDIKKTQNIEIPLPNILSISQLPSKCAESQSTTTILFKLKGRLAKTYKLKSGEKLQDKKDDFIVISNSEEPLDKLLPRLMRYGELCEIVNPKYIRAEMINLLNDTLKNYE